MVNQLYILISFFISGLLIGLLFDIFRITRRTFKLPNIIIYIEDILFWILTGVIVIGTNVVSTDGQIRLYMILMLMVGSVIYFLIISKYFMKINLKIIDFIKKIIKIILKPFHKIGTFLKNIIKFKKIFKK